MSLRGAAGDVAISEIEGELPRSCPPTCPLSFGRRGLGRRVARNDTARNRLLFSQDEFGIILETNYLSERCWTTILLRLVAIPAIFTPRNRAASGGKVVNMKLLK